MSASQQDFKQALANWPSGVCIVTSQVNGQPAGMTVSAFFSASLHPLLVGVCLDNNSHTLKVILQAGHFAVSILSSEQSALSDRFAKTGNEAIRFDDLDLLSVANTHSPLIAGALVHLDCQLHCSSQAGDHTLCLGEPQWIQHSSSDPLVFQSWKYQRLATEPNVGTKR